MDRGHSEDIYVVGDIILKSILKEWGGKLWKDCISGRGGVCGPIKYGEILDCLRHYQLLKKDSAHWIVLVLCYETDRAASSNVLFSDVTDCCVLFVYVSSVDYWQSRCAHQR